MIFSTPPKNQGQTVEYAYAAVGDGTVLRRRTDRSDGSVSYCVADLSDPDDDAVGVNRDPRIVGDWAPADDFSETA